MNTVDSRDKTPSERDCYVSEHHDGHNVIMA